MKCNYPSIISQDKGYTAISDLSLNFPKSEITSILVSIIEKLPSDSLGFLAKKLGVDGENGLVFCKNEKEVRELLKSAVYSQRIKGTPASIKILCKMLDFGDVEIIENPNGDKWYEYTISVNRLITKEKAKQLKRMVKIFAPASRVLVQVKAKYPLKYNGKGKYNGIYTFGAY